MGAHNRRYPTADLVKLTLSPEALAILPAVADFLEETAKGLRYKADREGFVLAAETLREERAVSTPELGEHMKRERS